MSRFTSYAVFALFAVAVFVTPPPLFADHHEGKATDESQEAAMQEWMKYAQPGDMHKSIAKFEGTWEASTMMWMEPGADPMSSVASSKNEMMLGGRYLRQSFKGNIMGMAFEGVGITGYDNYSKMFTSLWMDNTSTMIMVFEGTTNEEGQVVMTGKYKDPRSGETKTSKSLSYWRDDDTHVFEMWEKAPDGTQFKHMEMVYTRSGGDQAKK